MKLSASTLKIFQECPRCFWLHIHKRILRPRGPFPSLPSGIDRVLKAYFDTYRQQGVLPPLIDGKLKGTLATSALTLGFDDARTQATLWGKLDDAVILPDGRVAPLDHKTRASAPSDVSYTTRYYQFQMDVYTLLLERNGHPTSRTAYVVYYFPVEGALHTGFPFEMVVHTVPTDPEGAYKIFTAGCRCLEGPLPDSGKACEYCRWADVRRTVLPQSAPAQRRPWSGHHPGGHEMPDARASGSGSARSGGTGGVPATAAPRSKIASTPRSADHQGRRGVPTAAGGRPPSVPDDLFSNA